MSFSPFGKFVKGMSVIDKQYRGYGKTSGGGCGRTTAGRVTRMLNAWLLNCCAMTRNCVPLLLLISSLTFAQPAQQPQQPAPPTGLARLRANIEQVASGVDTHWGIYIKCLDTNEEIAINADEPMDTMSVIKVPLMVEAFRQIGEGKFSLADRYTLKNPDKRPGTGVIRSLDEGA